MEVPLPTPQSKSDTLERREEETPNHTSVSYPYTRFHGLSSTKVSGLGTRIINIQPLRSFLMREILEAEDTPPKSANKNNEKETNSETGENSKESVKSTWSDDENDLNATIVKMKDEDNFMPGVSRLKFCTPAKSFKESATIRAYRESNDIKCAIQEDKAKYRSVSETRKEDKPSASIGETFFPATSLNSVDLKTPVVNRWRGPSESLLSSGIKPTNYSNNTNLNSEIKTPGGQRIQCSIKSTIRGNQKFQAPKYPQPAKLSDYITPRKDIIVNRHENRQNIKYETPRQNHIQSSSRYETPKHQFQTPLQKQNIQKQNIQASVKKPEILREKNMNVISDNQRNKESLELERQKESLKEAELEKQNAKERLKETEIEKQKAKQNVQFSMPIPLPNLPDKTFKSLTVRGKEYIMISKLGEGGSCQVFNCLEPETLQHRAIKIVNLAVDAITANGYINEVRMLGSLQGSEHVVKMFDYEHSKQTLFVVMEKGGIDLSVFLRNIATKSSQLPTYVINYYWMEMLYCVKEIHDNGIIHSDLKPSNFLIVDGRLKLIDFGIASRLSSEMTSVIKNVQVGTFNYISPEALLDSRENNSPCIDGKPRIRISYKSDVWSLGCILYQMIYKRTPFHAIGNAWAKIAAIVDENHIIEYPQASGIPKELIDTIKKCLVHEMKKRPTVLELLTMSNGVNC